MGRKKASNQSSSEQNIQHASMPQDFEIEPNPKKTCSFKLKTYEAIKNNSSGKKMLKNFKQIILNERSLSWSARDADYTYSSIDALPSFKPQKKYSDISGIPALYTDPHSKLRYSNSEEFSRIKTLPSDIVSGLLNLRKASGCNS